MSRKILGAFLCTALSIPVTAAEINIDSVMNSQARRACIAGAGSIGKRMLCGDASNKNTLVKDITITSGAVRYAQVSNSPLPSSITTKTFTYSNCGSTPINYQKTESIALENVASITTKDSIKTTSGATAKINVGLAEFGYSFSKEVTFESQKTIEEKSVRTDTLQISKVIPANTLLLVKQDVRNYNSWFDFSGDLYLDGVIGIINKRYSAVVPNNFVSVAGQIFNVKSEMGSTIFQEIPISPTSCTPLQLSRSSLQIQKSKDSEVKSNSLLGELKDNAVPLKGSDVSPIQTIEKFTDSAVISTSDVVANIQVRAQVVGDEYCSATFYAGSEKREVVVPPRKWSEWTTLTTSIGRQSYSLAKVPVCKSEIISEIRYY